MIKKFSEEHKIAYMVILLSLLLLLSSCDAISVATNKSDYTKVTGEVIGTYTKRTGTRRHRSTIKYLEISFIYEVEVHYATGIKANFWEGVGDTVDFYISSDGTATRGAITISLSTFIVLIFFLAFVVKELWTKRDIIFTRPHTPVGTVIDDYSFTSPEASKEPAFHSNMTDRIAQNNLSQNISSQTAVTMENKNLSTNDAASIPIPNEFAKDSDSKQPQPEASFHDIPVISIPDEYLR